MSSGTATRLTLDSKGASPQQYVDRLSGEPARRQACRIGASTVAVEVS
jgi:hypothetical protein